MENERREEPQQQSEPQTDTPRPESSFQDESRYGQRGGNDRGDERSRDQGEGRTEFASSEGAEPPPSSGYEEPPQEDRPHAEGQPPSDQGGQNQLGQGRNRRRGGRGRMAGRDRRMQQGGRNRGRRDNRGPAPGGHGGHSSPVSHGGQHSAHPHVEGEEPRRSHSDLPPEQRSWILEARAEVERIREVLEGVLRDLDEVSDQLTKAEHEKDIAEAEIEQLRDSLRRLHR